MEPYIEFLVPYKIVGSGWLGYASGCQDMYNLHSYHSPPGDTITITKPELSI